MDPDETQRQIRELAEELGQDLVERARGLGLLQELADRCFDLSEWIQNMGFAPKNWVAAA